MKSLKNNQSGVAHLLLILLIVAVIGAVGFVGYKVATKKKPAVSTSTESSTNKSGDLSVTLKSDVKKTESCGDQGCFEKKFKACEKSTLKAETGFGSGSYEIYGPKNKGCEMLFKFTDNPNKAWVDKNLVCVFNNSLEFQKAIEAKFGEITSKNDAGCSGPLLKEIQAIT